MDIPDDIFTEPEDVDPDTLANLGPLRWSGSKGSSTFITQKVTISGNVSPDMRSHLEGLRSTGTSNMLAAGQIPSLG